MATTGFEAGEPEQSSRDTQNPTPGPRGSSIRIGFALVVAVLVVIVDQVTTWIVERDLHSPVHLWGPLGLSLTYNSGSAFSLFTGQIGILIPVIIVLIVALLWAVWKSTSVRMAVVLGLILGGALGNLFDRFFGGHGGSVVDFITLSHWPTFNFADMSITVGVILFVGLTVFHSPDHDASKGEPA